MHVIDVKVAPSPEPLSEKLQVRAELSRSLVPALHLPRSPPPAPRSSPHRQQLTDSIHCQINFFDRIVEVK